MILREEGLARLLKAKGVSVVIRLFFYSSKEALKRVKKKEKT